MYEINEYVVIANIGICKIIDICSPDFAQEEVLYYKIQPLNNPNDTIYVPINNDKVLMRKIISKQEVNDFIMQMPSIEPVWFENEKDMEFSYKEAMKSNDCYEWIKMIKGLYMKKQERIKQGKKPSQTSEKRFNKAQDTLMKEFAIALDIPIEEALSYIENKIEVSSNHEEMDS